VCRYIYVRIYLCRLLAAQGHHAFLSILFFSCLLPLPQFYCVCLIFTTGFRLSSVCLAGFPVMMVVLLCLTSSALEIPMLGTGELQQLQLWIILILSRPPIKMLVSCTLVGLEKSLVPHFSSSLRVPHVLRGPCYDKHAWALQTVPVFLCPLT